MHITIFMMHCLAFTQVKIRVEWRDSRPDWAGMDQHNDVTGEAAVDMLIDMLHRGETSISEFPRATLIGPTWVDGATVMRAPGD